MCALKCQPDGELPAGRSRGQSLAVHISHPAAKKMRQPDSILQISFVVQCKGGFFMKTLKEQFGLSFGELKKLRTITTCAMLAAVSAVLGYFTIQLGDFIKIGFSTIPNQLVHYLFGPVTGSLYGGMLDIVKYLIKPTGPYFPGFTISAAIGGIIYGVGYYKKPMTLKRILVTELIAAVICNMFLGTLWLNMLYGKAFFTILPMRVLKNLVMWPINSVIFFSCVQGLERAGVFRIMGQRV